MDVLQSFFCSLFTLGDPSAASVSFPIALEFGAVLAGAVSGAWILSECAFLPGPVHWAAV